MIAAMEAAIEEAIEQSGAPLDDMQAQVALMRQRFDVMPDAVTEAHILDQADMLWAFLAQSFTNIRRFFKALSNDTPDGVILFDGTWNFDGSKHFL